MSDLPNSFEEILSFFEEEVHGGISNRKSEYHLVGFSTINLNYEPEVRYMVLRNFDPEKREILLHTDIRSQKVEEIISNDNSQLIFYDHKNKTQLRLRASISVHHNDDIAEKEWQKTQPMSKYCYLCTQVSGSFSDKPWDGIDPSDKKLKIEGHLDEAAYKNFAVLRCEYYEIDYLRLSHLGHVRALLSYDDKKFEGKWIIP